MNSWAVSACYPQSTFYPLSDGPSIQNHRITKTYFRICSTCGSLQLSARFCLYTLRTISDRSERTFVLSVTFRRRPPHQTTHHTLSSALLSFELEPQHYQGGISRMAPQTLACLLQSLPPHPTGKVKVQCKAVVKVHGVFPSSRGYTASSLRF